MPFKASWPVLLILLALLLHAAPAMPAEHDKIMIYFYSSETGINNFKSLKMAFDGYLSEIGPYELQPFSERGAFEQQAKENSDSVLLLTGWHYSSLRRSYPMKAVLVGVQNGRKRQKRILVHKGQSVPSELAKVEPIASASSIEYTMSILKTMTVLRSMMPGSASVDSLRILAVPKDIDALLSVGVGISKAALAMESSLERLKTLNPALRSEMKTIAESKESLSLIAAVPQRFLKRAEEPLKIIREMDASTNGREVLKMIGLDGWQMVDSDDLSELEGK